MPMSERVRNSPTLRNAAIMGWVSIVIAVAIVTAIVALIWWVCGQC